MIYILVVKDNLSGLESRCNRFNSLEELYQCERELRHAYGICAAKRLVEFSIEEIEKEKE